MNGRQPIEVLQPTLRKSAKDGHPIVIGGSNIGCGTGTQAMGLSSCVGHLPIVLGVDGSAPAEQLANPEEAGGEQYKARWLRGVGGDDECCNSGIRLIGSEGHASKVRWARVLVGISGFGAGVEVGGGYAGKGSYRRLKGIEG